MIAILQRVSHSSVAIDGECVASCEKGLLILLGVAEGDTEDDARVLSEKISKLRIFEDCEGKMNLSVNDVNGSAVVVPNFTLLASCKKGNRPDFFGGARPDAAKKLFTYFCDLISNLIRNVGRGVFGADMKVDLCNDGPVTISLDSRELRKSKQL